MREKRGVFFCLTRNLVLLVLLASLVTSASAVVVEWGLAEVMPEVGGGPRNGPSRGRSWRGLKEMRKTLYYPLRLKILLYYRLHFSLNNISCESTYFLHLKMYSEICFYPLSSPLARISVLHLLSDFSAKKGLPRSQVGLSFNFLIDCRERLLQHDKGKRRKQNIGTRVALEQKSI